MDPPKNKGNPKKRERRNRDVGNIEKMENKRYHGQKEYNRTKKNLESGIHTDHKKTSRIQMESRNKNTNKRMGGRR